MVPIIIVDTIKDNIEIKEVKPNIYQDMLTLLEEQRRHFTKREALWF